MTLGAGTIERLERSAAVGGVRIRYHSADEAWRLALRMAKIVGITEDSRRDFEQAADEFAEARNHALEELRRMGLPPRERVEARKP